MFSCLVLFTVTLNCIFIHSSNNPVGINKLGGSISHDSRYGQFRATRERRARGGFAAPTTKQLALAGAVIGKVLNTMAKEIFTDGYNRVYAKRGGQKQCYQDFYSVSPKSVKNINEHTTIGRVGNLELKMEEKTGRSILILRLRKGKFSSVANPPVDYIVVYKH